jgi:hypothetical protein
MTAQAKALEESLNQRLQQAITFEESESTDGKAIPLYEAIYREGVKEEEDLTEGVVKVKENAVYRIAKLFMRKGLYDNLIDLQKEILPKFKDFPKTKTAKIIRTLYDLTLTIPAPEVKDALERHYKMLMDTARFIIEWCK